jgi:hypothetical protein
MLSNKTHRSKTDPDALLARTSKADPALPSFRGHVLMDNRHALIVDCQVTHRKTVGADKGYDTKGFVAEMRAIGVHAPRGAGHQPAPGLRKSINACRGIEQVFAGI